MYYAEIKKCDIANGPGVRTSLFVSGCRLHCRNCFNEIAWNFSYGEPFTPEVGEDVIQSVMNPFMDGITILGGEPTEPENQEGLVEFLEHAREEFGPRGAKGSKTIWLFSGHTWEQIACSDGSQHGPYTQRILDTLDVMVDGPFVQKQYDISLRFRGSANQRLIDVPATQAAHATGTLTGNNDVIPWEDDPVFSTHTME